MFPYFMFQQIALRVAIASLLMWTAAAQADQSYGGPTQGRTAAPSPVFLTDQWGNYPGVMGQAGSVGTDASANKPTIPNIGGTIGTTTFGAAPYAAYILIAVIAANPARQNIDIENTSGGQIAIVRDDGTAASGNAPANASVFALGGGVGAGSQGGAWSSLTFKGRIQIYAPSSTAQVAIFQD